MSTNLFQLEYDGLSLSNTSFNVNKLSGIDGLPIRVSEDNLTGRHGGRIWNRKYGMRTISIEGTIVANSATEYWDLKAQLNDAFSIHDFKELKITRWDGVTRVINALVVVAPVIVESATQATFCNYQVTLRCESPFFKDEDAQFFSTALATGGGFPLQAPIDTPIGSKTGGAISIDNTGEETFADFTINGDVDTPLITNLTTGKSFSIQNTIPLGQFVTVRQTESGLFVLLNGSTNYFPFFEGDFFPIAKGINVIRFTAAASSATATLEVTYKNSYISL